MDRVIVAINTQQADAVNQAAKQYGVPQGILWGVWGMETNFGQDVKTSSAGAVGNFQFTAADKGTGVTYPMTNTPTAAQFQQQADAAAAYLASLFGQHKSWDAALKAYSGGGYGYSQVQAKSQNIFPMGIGQNLHGPISTPVGQVVSNVKQAAATASDVYGMLTSGAFWLRVLEALGGIILIGLGLVTLTGKGGDVATVAATAAKVVK